MWLTAVWQKHRVEGRYVRRFTRLAAAEHSFDHSFAANLFSLCRVSNSEKSRSKWSTQRPSVWRKSPMIRNGPWSHGVTLEPWNSTYLYFLSMVGAHKQWKHCVHLWRKHKLDSEQVIGKRWPTLHKLRADEWCSECWRSGIKHVLFVFLLMLPERADCGFCALPLHLPTVHGWFSNHREIFSSYCIFPHFLGTYLTNKKINQ